MPLHNHIFLLPWTFLLRLFQVIISTLLLFSSEVTSDSFNPWTVAFQGSSVHVISQTGIHEWIAIYIFRGSFWPKHQTNVSCIVKQTLPLRHKRSPIIPVLLIDLYSLQRFLSLFWILFLTLCPLSRKFYPLLWFQRPLSSLLNLQFRSLTFISSYNLDICPDIFLNFCLEAKMLSNWICQKHIPNIFPCNTLNVFLAINDTIHYIRPKL